MEFQQHFSTYPSAGLPPFPSNPSGIPASGGSRNSGCNSSFESPYFHAPIVCLHCNQRPAAINPLNGVTFCYCSVCAGVFAAYPTNQSFNSTPQCWVNSGGLNLHVPRDPSAPPQVTGNHRPAKRSRSPVPSGGENTPSPKRRVGQNACTACIAGKAKCVKAETGPCARCAEKAIPCIPGIDKRTQKTNRKELQDIIDRYKAEASEWITILKVLRESAANNNLAELVPSYHDPLDGSQRAVRLIRDVAQGRVQQGEVDPVHIPSFPTVEMHGPKEAKLNEIRKSKEQAHKAGRELIGAIQHLCDSAAAGTLGDDQIDAYIIEAMNGSFNPASVLRPEDDNPRLSQTPRPSPTISPKDHSTESSSLSNSNSDIAYHPAPAANLEGGSSVYSWFSDSERDSFDLPAPVVGLEDGSFEIQLPFNLDSITPSHPVSAASQGDESSLEPSSAFGLEDGTVETPPLPLPYPTPDSDGAAFPGAVESEEDAELRRLLILELAKVDPRYQQHLLARASVQS
ncbi:hypothetical protein DL766_004817 [Monosporascus sp. MC13-8B]|uniref:Zn(2)-C6 fungal-type domain-containing protein n=1 Tax=Monosporascus cannonballus TaxID=155416 RepID=A0ABY0HGS0_9PEZI|nr:hypothetical protein DL762_001254 [Monosporascus cannonballus]RYP30545.1 hypothetical protein DL766_004817 [Monosporascus sp. MC13-8B]